MIHGPEADRVRDPYSATPDPTSPTWFTWGPYLSERQWGTVREDYSADGDAWSYFTHDQARSRAYRWGEDGLAGLSDDQQRLCFSIALWNGVDPIVKERLFGLTNDEGNHGEDVKEYYFFLDSTPTHSYMKWLYKYPQLPFPYADLVDENGRRKRTDGHAAEYELLDTGVFADDRYFDVQVEYAKAATDDVLVRITVDNRGPDDADLHLLPTLWFRNTWSWYHDAPRPIISASPAVGEATHATIRAEYADGSPERFGTMFLHCNGADDVLVVDNESNGRRLWGSDGGNPYPKDGINDHLVHGADTVNPLRTGTKASSVHRLHVAAGGRAQIELRLTSDDADTDPFGRAFDTIFESRVAEADQFYTALGPCDLNEDQRSIQRQAYAGMLWSKQYYHYVVRDWLAGDPVGPTPPGRTRNAEWSHFHADHILSMPDTWEYPWFAAWDLCFQSVVIARVDAEFAKRQLLILAREFFMSPDGAVPAYEWAFSDVNPPLHAWAALRIFEIDREQNGGDGDTEFLSDIFRYCLIYFTWWANRKDARHRNLFEGGFLGLDNIAVVDRSHLDQLEQALGTNVDLYQSDGTSWMGMFSLHLMEMAISLAGQGQREHARLASKFFQHFIFIADAMNSIERRADGHVSVWDDEDGFFYDVLRVGGTGGAPDEYVSLRLRSLVGVIALFPVSALDLDTIAGGAAGELGQRVAWFARNHPDLLGQAVTSNHRDGDDRRLLSFVTIDQLRRILSRVFDESEFLGPHGIRGISRVYHDEPFEISVRGMRLEERYEPAESSIGLFGGNSNWRGPVWFPINFMLIETLRRYHEFVGDEFTIEYPTRSGRELTLAAIADDLSARLVSIFERGADGKRPVNGGTTKFDDPHWRDLVLFYEYFHGDDGAGLGASHQTGWTGLVAELLRHRPRT